MTIKDRSADYLSSWSDPEFPLGKDSQVDPSPEEIEQVVEGLNEIIGA